MTALMLSDNESKVLISLLMWATLEVQTSPHETKTYEALLRKLGAGDRLDSELASREVSP